MSNLIEITQHLNEWETRECNSNDSMFKALSSSSTVFPTELNNIPSIFLSCDRRHYYNSFDINNVSITFPNELLSDNDVNINITVNSNIFYKISHPFNQISIKGALYRFLKSAFKNTISFHFQSENGFFSRQHKAFGFLEGGKLKKSFEQFTLDIQNNLDKTRDIVDQEALIELAKNSAYHDVRLAAIIKVKDSITLGEIAKSDLNNFIKQTCINTITDDHILLDVIVNLYGYRNTFRDLNEMLVEKMTDENLISEAILNFDDPYLVKCGLKKIKSTDLLTKISKTHVNEYRRSQIIEEIEKR
jgi:hypothetical protein